MKPVAFDAAAAVELDEAVDYHDAQVEGLGARLEAEIEQALARVAANPKLYRRLGRTSNRRCRVRDFSYFIYFQERSDYIWVAAVAHTSRRPDYWRGRKPPG